MGLPKVLAIDNFVREMALGKFKVIDLYQSQNEDQTISCVLNFANRKIKPSPREISQESQSIKRLLHKWNN